MRYFKYWNSNKTEQIAKKAQYAELTAHEKKLVRRGKVLSAIANILFYSIFIICLGFSILALEQIPISQNAFVAVLEYVGIVILGIGACIASLLIGVLVSSPFFSKVDTSHRIMKQNVLSQACAHLRKFYGLQEPCIVTKCYESSDEKFKDHDVCIFVVGDELRITTNLKRGFFHSENDLGCYAFERDEIYLAKIQGQRFLTTELKADGVVFLLGYRAKSFIETHFVSNGHDT